MKEVSPQLQAAFTNKLLNDFAKGLQVVLKSRLSAIAGKVPNATLKLISYQIMEASASDISAKYMLYFQDSGRLSEMKNLRAGGQLPVEEILAWIRRGRAALFKSIPGYGREAGAIEQAKKEERIAWAIAKSKGKIATSRRGRKLKERQWINKNFYSWYNRLIEDFILKQSETLQNLVKQGMQPLEKLAV